MATSRSSGPSREATGQRRILPTSRSLQPTPAEETSAHEPRRRRVPNGGAQPVAPEPTPPPAHARSAGQAQNRAQPQVVPAAVGPLPPAKPAPKKKMIPLEERVGRVPERLSPEALARPAPPSKPRNKPRKPTNEPNVPPGEVCTVLYEDKDLLVVDKHPGYPVVPAGAYHRRSVLRVLGDLGYGNLYPISLLDAEASGVVILSRSEVAAQALRWNWRSNLCERQFIAVAQGDIQGARGRITLPIGAVRHGQAVRHQVMTDGQGGRPAETRWRLLARGRGMSRLQITLKGGRCHQIRIHLAAIGYPIVGDRVYGAQKTEVPLSALVEMPSKYHDIPTLPPSQIALHCSKVTMPHPLTHEPMEWTAPVPRILLALMPGAWIVDET